jgi:hypothetical protein
MDAAMDALERKKQQHLAAAAEVELEQQRRQGLFDGVPHYNQIEAAGHRVGTQLSRVVQARLANETAADAAAEAACPGCGKTCRVEQVRRRMTSIDGPVELLEPQAHCPACRRAFFPSA